MLDFKYLTTDMGMASGVHELKPLLMESYDFESSWRFVVVLVVCCVTSLNRNSVATCVRVL